ncbi:DegT/DnrJ/EryC1/StrS family aminotransferase [Clostridium butyricum]|uniref:Aminotransferase DegT n=1 Tax=Clostridium butyricum TaxID=1492 RepID=A0A2S7FAF6_CLOBU|nr:DegT/DnrJ/EryC1/StrS family aminotransferase [Clostridium butyricum]KHD15801.1 aminotransferase DegT [Clostridium butyricum]PPV14658.1 aminotransferase DegT [Clostridium butyricum]
MNYLEKFLAIEYKKNNAYFTGNGTTALYLIFKSLNMQRKKILFPNITCMAPVNAAIYAGYDVEFCDVNINDFTIDVTSMIKMIKKKNIGVVVPTHIYGNICDMKKIYEFCRNEKIIIIEDAAQNSEISIYNDFAITSFGHTKLCETSRGGGVIFFKDKSYYRKFDYYSRELKSKSNSEDFEVYTEKYYKIVKNFKGRDFYYKMKKLQLESKDIFLRHFKENKEVYESVRRKNIIINERKKRINLYYEKLNENFFVFYNNENSLWRLSLLVKNIDRDNFVKKVRENNVDISTWYPCLNRFYNNQSDEDVKNSLYVSDYIVNFWVTEKYTIEKIENDIQIINAVLKKL